MFYVIVFITILFFCLSLSDTSHWYKGQLHFVSIKDTKRLVFFSLVILYLIVLFRPQNMPDYQSYIRDFKYLDKYMEYNMEPGDKLLIKTVHLFTDHYMFVFAAFAAIGVPMKVYATRKMTPFVFLSLAVYASGMMIAQDMVAMRSSLAAGFFLWAIYYKLKHNLRMFLILAFVAVSFHYSAVLVFPVWFLNTKKDYRKIYGLLIPIAYAAIILGQGITMLFDSINIPLFQAIWYNYKYFEEEDAYNVFNIIILFKVCFFYLMYFKLDEIKEHYSSIVLLMKIYCISLFITILLYQSQAVAIRVGDFLRCVEILFVPSLLFAYGGKYRVKLHIICLIYCLLSLAGYNGYF